jgi:SAM-dependent methyltransferase
VRLEGEVSVEPSREYAVTAAFYDRIAPYAERGDTAFYVEAAKRSGGPVLEVGCGTGRVLVPTAEAGVEIVGIDCSDEMLKVCRERLAQLPEPLRSLARVVREDMRDFDLGQRFALVTVPFRPFQHLLTVEDQLRCLACLRRHMAAGAELILDVFNPSLSSLVADNIGEEISEEPEFTMPDGTRVARTYRTTSRDLFGQVIEVELIYHVTHPDGREERLVDAFPLRYLFRFELEHLLVRAGFRLERLYGSFDERPYGSTAYPGELIAVASPA